MTLDFNDAPTLRPIDPEAWERRIATLRTTLAARARELVADIFPRARFHGLTARIGSTQGEAGESLAVETGGDRAGLWHDHATGGGGDLIDLWMETRGYGKNDFAKAVEDLERWVGLSAAPRFASPVTRLAEKRRAEVANEPKPDAALGPPVASWHYLSADGAILAIVRRYDRDEIDATTGKRKKTFRPFTATGEPRMPDPRPLYRLPQIKNASEVVLVEGEKAADALQQVGVEATTAMGGSKADPAKTDWTPLAGKTVFVWEDNDAAGEGLCERVRPYIEAVGGIVAPIAIPPGKPATWDAADAVDEGEDVGAMIEAARGDTADKTAPKKRLSILSRSQLRDRERPDYLVDEVVTERSVIAIYGPSGSLKSFAAIDMGMAVAHGRPWHGRDVKQGAVVYVTGEGANQISQRLDAWDIANDAIGSDAPFHLIPFGVPVSDPAWVNTLISEIRDAGIAPAMIWLDTLARTFGLGDENSQKDMNAYISGVDRLRDELGCVVGIVHHTGKDGNRGLRGSSALYAAMDTVIRTDRKNLTVTLKNQQPHGKQKDGAEFDDIALQASVVTLDQTDKKGRPLSSLALKKVDVGAGPEPDSEGGETANASPRGANQQAVMKALKQAKGEALGLTRLLTMTRIDKSRFYEAVEKLVEKGLVEATGTEGATKWRLR